MVTRIQEFTSLPFESVITVKSPLLGCLGLTTLALLLFGYVFNQQHVESFINRENP